MVASPSDDFLRAEQAAQFILAHQSAPAHRPGAGVRTGRRRRRVKRRRFASPTKKFHIFRRAPPRVMRAYLSSEPRQHSLGGAARPRASLRRLLAEPGCASRARIRTHGSACFGADECRRWNQSRNIAAARWWSSRDHINLQGQNPLIGPNDERLGLRHPDMTDAYNAQFRQFVREESERLGGGIFEGVYAAVTGPNFETPAEIRFLRTIGADLVGMSTVPEVIAARHMGMEVLAISVRDQHGRWHDRRKDHGRGSGGDRRTPGRQVSCAVARGVAQDRRLFGETRQFRLTLSSRGWRASALH